MSCCRNVLQRMMALASILRIYAFSLSFCLLFTLRTALFSAVILMFCGKTLIFLSHGGTDICICLSDLFILLP